MHMHHSFEENLPNPVPVLSEPELRETAYEILVAACRSSELKPLTFKSNSKGNGRITRSPCLHRLVSCVGESKVKKELGMKSLKGEGGKKSIRTMTMGELMRVQMKVSEMNDTRIRRALLRVSKAKLGKRIELMVLPLELIQHLKCSDFHSQQDYESWIRRNLKVLEAGLILHPHLPLDHKSDSSAQTLKQIINESLKNPMDIANNNESMQNFRDFVKSLACRSYDESATQICHWADGFPLNLMIYQALLEACFDNNEETFMIEEVDEVLELIKKTWNVLGMNEMLHNICFSWVLFHQYVVTGQVENDLLSASSNLLREAEKDFKSMTDPFYSKSVSSILSLMLGWAEKRLLAYHDTFCRGNVESMQSIVSLAVSSAKILVEDMSLEFNNKMRIEANVSCSRVENYIRSSLHDVFTQQKLEKLDPRKHASRKQNKALLSLAVLAQDISELAFYEKETFSPILKRWHPHAAGVAVATLHLCYGNELKQYVRSIKEMTPDAVKMLLAADKLEKDLVHIAVEDSIDSEDGGKSIIREMHPYESEVVIANLVKSWIKTRVERLEEWVDRSLQQEVWNPRANDGIALSAVQVLRVIDDSVEAFFQLPIPMHAVLLPKLISGLDKSLHQYILKAKSGCGNPNSFIPTMPALTRCSTGSKLHGLFKRKEKIPVTQRRKSQVGATNIDSSFGLPQLCVRINTLQHIRMELKVLEKRTISHLGSSKSTNDNDIEGVLKFKLSEVASIEGIHQLCEAIAYKITFHDLCHVLWDGLYVGEVSPTRIVPFLEELEQCLKIISSIVHDDKAKTHVLTEVMKACVEGFMMVLLGGGPSRAFSLEDSVIIKEDFRFLTDLFRFNEDNGLPAEIREKHSTNAKGVLTLFGMDTETLIQQFNQLNLEMYGSSAKSKSPLPSTPTQWSPRKPDTLFHVLCHRNDEIAAKFLKKNYNLPTKL
ncbi:hypothetical protein TanjilG_00037 [Lupinus angustifolius]|uniref:MHD1 domain-containing protein n=1 Tax=Lupinus angustifolius TaxID=3871 RepID=A0A4P1QSY6_LUPAN|nr:hypothetical protein TanjilG_00037 [Lupinus angustifolius]